VKPDPLIDAPREQLVGHVAQQVDGSRFEPGELGLNASAHIVIPSTITSSVPATSSRVSKSRRPRKPGGPGALDLEFTQ
jgi:hypothetical protein